MATGGVIRVDGVKELRRTLKAAGADMNDFTVINRAAAAIVAPIAVSRAPQGPGVNGHISQTVRIGATRTAGIIRVGNNTKFRYGGPIHWGWPAHNIQPNPWVTEAARDTEGQWIEKYVAGLDHIVSQVKGV